MVSPSVFIRAYTLAVGSGAICFVSPSLLLKKLEPRNKTIFVFPKSNCYIWNPQSTLDMIFDIDTLAGQRLDAALGQIDSIITAITGANIFAIIIRVFGNLDRLRIAWMHHFGYSDFALQRRFTISNLSNSTAKPLCLC